MWSGFGTQIAQPSVVVVSDRDVKADRVSGLRPPKTGAREQTAEPARVDGVDGIERYPELDHETVRAQSRLRFPYNAWIVGGVGQALVAY